MAGTMTAADLTARLAGPLQAAGLVLEEVTVTPAGKRRVVRVLVDRDLASLDLAEDDAASRIAPLTLVEVADATRIIDAELDGDDDGPAYTLEVSSPGIGRKLTEFRHFRRNVGRLVKVTTTTGQLTGRLQSATPTELVVLVAGTAKVPDRRETVPMDQVTRARVEVDFSGVDTAELDTADLDTADLDQAEAGTEDAGRLQEEND